MSPAPTRGTFPTKLGRRTAFASWMREADVVSAHQTTRDARRQAVSRSHLSWLVGSELASSAMLTPST